jgi:uncharacterized membrane protein YbhN (UPF0104 family)
MIKRFFAAAMSWRIAALALVFAGACLLISRLLLDADSWRVLQDNALLLIPATGLIVLAIIGWGLCWAQVLQGLGGGRGVSNSLRVFIYTWLGRYVPGTLPYHAARVLSAETLGVTRTKVAASIAYETVLLLGSGALVGAAGVLIGVGADESSLVYLLAALPLLSLPLLLRPTFLVPLANRILTLARREPIGREEILSSRQLLAAFAFYAAVHLINGLSFLLVIETTQEVSVNPALAIGAYSLAGVIGTAVIFVPSGIGVREAVLVALLSSTVAPEAALLAAGTARAISVLADLVPLAALGIIELARRILLRHRTAAGSASLPPGNGSISTPR